MGLQLLNQHLSVVLLLTVISMGYCGQICHVCNDIPRPEDCPNVMECGQHETCSTESYLSPRGHILYKMSCKDTTQCGGYDINSIYTPICSGCCDGNLCGASLCGNNGYLNNTGPVCFNCIYKVDHPTHCGKIKVCSRDEKCGVKKFEDGLYELTCLSTDKCTTPEPHTTCTSCCQSNVCNTDCKLTSECKDSSLCPDLITSVPNLCSSTLAKQCNGTCVCNGNGTGIPGPTPGVMTVPSTVSSTLKVITTPTSTPTTPTSTPTVAPTTTALPLLSTEMIYHFPNGSICDDEPACDYMSKIPNFCSNAELMVYCYKTCGMCGLYASGTGSVGGGVVVPDHCAQHSCVHGRCVSNTQSYTCSCDIGFMGALCDHHNPCHSQPCVHGQCEVLTSTGGYQCKCDLGFSGTSCDISLVRDCQDVLDYNVQSSTHDDIYLIDITETFMDAKKLNVKCEFNDDNGWTVIMNRNSGQLNFDDKDSSAYATGFGNARGEFWMGLEYMHFMTSDGRRYQLRIDFTLANGSHYYEIYNDFSVGPHTKFALSVGNSYGNAGDSLSGHNTFGFTTKDRDQDSNSRENCASYISGGWWFHNCADSCLTCNYVTPGTYDCRSMSWNALGYCIGLKAVSMKIRPM